MRPATSTRETVEQLAEEFVERYRRGESPAISEYTRRFPRHADEIRELFPTLLLMERIAPDSQPSAASPASLPVAEELSPSRQFGDYRIIREVGRGGMGIVYEAEQLTLGRRVALKVLTRPALLDPKQKLRFEREARAAANLHHTNIVTIFDVGVSAGMHYYAMQFIQGQSLDEVLRELRRLKGCDHSDQGYPGQGRDSTVSVAADDVARSLINGLVRCSGDRPHASRKPSQPVQHELVKDTPAKRVSAGLSDTNTAHWSDTICVTSPSLSKLPPSMEFAAAPRTYWQGVAAIGIQTAEALQYAHDQGILHRDIKPANLLLDMRGNVWVTDFGLAHAQDEHDLTHTGDILGTLRYMAPEVFSGKTDARSEVYALGLTLFELLALRPAFEESDRNLLFRQLTTQGPPRLDKLNSEVPRDLVTIVHKAMDRDREHRYATAKELANDLRRFFNDQPIRSRRVSLAERAFRWARQNKAIAGSLTLIAAFLLIAACACGIAAVRFERLAQANAKNFARARSAVDDLLIKVSEGQLVTKPGMQPVRAELLESASRFYEDFVEENAEDPELQGALAEAFTRLGKVNRELGNRTQAYEALERAIRFFEAALTQEPGNTELLDGLATACLEHGYLDYEHNAEVSLQHYSRAVSIRRKLVETHPAMQSYRIELARAYNGLGMTSARLRKPTQALEAYRRAFEIRQRLAEECPDDPFVLHGLGECFHNISRLFSPEHRREALELVLRATEYNRLAYQMLPHNVEFAEDLGVSYATAARDLAQLGRPGEAIEQSQNAVQHLNEFVRGNPSVPNVYRILLSSLDSLTLIEPTGEQQRGALQLYRQAYETCKQVTEAPPESFTSRARIAALYVAALESMAPPNRQAHHQEADVQRFVLTTLRQARTAGYDLNHILRAPALQLLLSDSDRATLTASRWPKAEGTVADARAAVHDRSSADPPDMTPEGSQDESFCRRLRVDEATLLSTICSLQRHLGQSKAADASLVRALEVYSDTLDRTPAKGQERVDLLKSRARLLALMQRWQDALTDYSLALQLAPADDELRLGHAEMLSRLGRWSEAEGDLSQAIRTQFEALLVDPQNPRLVRRTRQAIGLFSRRPLAADGEKYPAEWSYWTHKPGQGWETPAFDNSTWSKGKTPLRPASRLNRQSNRSEDGVWMRRKFYVSKCLPKELEFRILCNGQVELFLNGVFAGKVDSDCSQTYRHVRCPPEAASALHDGENLLAVSARLNERDARLDVGLYARTGGTQALEGLVVDMLDREHSRRLLGELQTVHESAAGARLPLDVRGESAAPHVAPP